MRTAIRERIDLVVGGAEHGNALAVDPHDARTERWNIFHPANTDPGFVRHLILHVHGIHDAREIGTNSSRSRPAARSAHGST